MPARPQNPSVTFLDTFVLKEMIGKGCFGMVWRAEHKRTNRDVAVKVIDRKKLKEKDDKAVVDEVSILRSLDTHPNVVNLIDFFESPKTFHVVLELARGGDVFARLSQRNFYNELSARSLAQNLLLAVEYIHSRGFVHRDLKPENLLLEGDDDSHGLKVADFGFSKRVPAKGLATRCGTPAFVAPEICSNFRYGNKVDVWSCGVILYLLLGGYTPFQSKDMKQLFRKIRAADYAFHEKYWDPISMPAKSLIVRMLTVDCAKRLSASEALKSKWMTMSTEDMVSTSKTSLPETVNQMKKFVAKQKLKSAMIATTYATTAKFWTGDAVSFMSRQTTLNAEAMNSQKTLSNGKVGQRFNGLYDLLDPIRQGRIGSVWRGTKRDDITKKTLAIKIIKMENCDVKEEARIMNEVSILQSLNHQNILRVHDFFEESPEFFVVMELMQGGDLYDSIVSRTFYAENDARLMAKSLLSAVEYMHERGVAHRDLKPQNLLLKTADSHMLKVADFTFSKRVHMPKSLFTRCGTPTYVAPEILKNHPHDNSADMWSVGVIIYTCLVGYPPFIEENQTVLFHKIRFGEYEFFDSDWHGISNESRDLIKKLLVVDPDRRTSAKIAINHPWFVGTSENLSMRDISASFNKLKQSMGNLDEFDQPENENYKSYQDLPDVEMKEYQ